MQLIVDYFTGCVELCFQGHTHGALADDQDGSLWPYGYVRIVAASKRSQIRADGCTGSGMLVLRYGGGHAYAGKVWSIAKSTVWFTEFHFGSFGSVGLRLDAEIRTSGAYEWGRLMK